MITYLLGLTAILLTLNDSVEHGNCLAQLDKTALIIVASVSQGAKMQTSVQMDNLKTTHRHTNAAVLAEEKRPKPDAEYLRRLKIRKLRLKDRMERLKTA